MSGEIMFDVQSGCRSVLATLGATAALVLAVACAASSSSGGEGGKNGLGGAAGTAGSAGDAASTGGFSGSTGGDAGIDVPCPVACSVDSRSVVDCNGEPVTACSALEACFDGGCKNACDQAKSQKSSVGCEYYAVNMEGIVQAVGGCFAVFIANTFVSPAHVKIEWEGTPLDLGKYARIPQGSGASLTYGDFDPAAGLGAGQVAIAFLANSPGAIVKCPVPAAVTSGAQLAGTGIGKAFRIVSDVPVVAYQMLPYGGGAAAVTGASLLLPTSAWGDNYVAVDAYAKSQIVDASPSLDIVASEDDTHVTLLPKVAIVGGPGVAASPAGTATTTTLHAGQVLQITQPEELTGSPIQADKPIGLFAGHVCLNVPVDASYCDHAEQQIPPVRALGHEHVGASYRQRFEGKAENRLWRIVGAAADTQLEIDPPIAGAPAAIGLGEVAEFHTDETFIVKSQDAKHPFLLLTYMSGSTAVEPGYGDADFVRIVPTGQYMNRYVFFTDPTYPETNLVVVRKKTKGGFEDVTLDCAGALSGWMPVGSSGDYQLTRVDLVRHQFEPQGSCDNGRHEMTSPGLFGLWIWGWGSPETGLKQFSQDVSYGYPAGENVTEINDVVIPVVK